MKLGILTTHPIQYQAPWFRALSKRIDVRVFFAHSPTPEQLGASGFGINVKWDIDLLSGYQYEYLANISPKPGINHFSGCDSPSVSQHVKGLDALLITGWHKKVFWQAIRACQKYGIPVFVRGDSHLGNDGSPIKRLFKRPLYSFLARKFNGFFYVGEKNKEYLRYYGVPERVCFFSPHAVDNDWFAAQSRNASTQVAQFLNTRNIDLNIPVVLFVGKLQPIKRVQDLIKASGELYKSSVDHTLLVVGSGECEEDLRLCARNHSIKAHFEGFVNQTKMPLCYAASDVLTLPSRSETWGLVVNEAMACGVPCVVSEGVGCAPDLISNNLTGITVPVGDFSSLSSSLMESFRFKGDENIQNAIAKRINLYSIDRLIDGIILGLERVLYDNASFR